MIRRRKTQSELLRACNSWNKRYPVGTRVLVRRDSGVIEETKTRSGAQLAESGVAVIFLEGIAGYYLLDRVEAI